MEILFSIHLAPDENYDFKKSVYEQDLAAHGQYLQKLMENGKLVLAGPFADNTGGQAIIRAGTELEALSLVDNDPSIINKVFSYEIHPWHIRFNSLLKKDGSN